jgi:hypothetical protein
MTPPKRKHTTRQGPPEGATPNHQSEHENERIRREGEAEGSGGSAERPDAKDEAFIESTKDPTKSS